MILTDYIVPSADELLDNYDFATDLSDWTDASGSWSWVSGGGTEYDNDGEFNPLTQDYVVAGIGSWYRLVVTQSVGATGTLIVEIRNSLGVPVNDSVTGDEYFYLYPDTYTFAILADNFDGSVESVSLKTIQYRPPTPEEDDIKFVESETVVNPVFATDLSGWTDATGSWTWNSNGGAEYDNDGDGNYLTQTVSLTAGWYRMGMQASDGVTADVLAADIAEIAGSTIDYTIGRRGVYFLVLTDDTYTLRLQAENLTGYVTQVTILEALNREAIYTLNKRVGDVPNVDVYDVRVAYDINEQAASVMLGRNAGFYAFSAIGSIAVGEAALSNGGAYSVAVGYNAHMNEGSDNTVVGANAWRDATGDDNVVMGLNAGTNNVGDQNTFIGTRSGQDAATNRSVLLGNQAGRNETTDDKFHVANTDTESLIKGDFVDRTLAFGFDDLSDGTATADLAASTAHPSLRSRGGVQLARKTVTATYTATLADYILCGNASGGAFSITLPAASGKDGLIYLIKKVDSSGNTVTVDGNGSETIDGATTKVLSAQYDTVTIVCDGSNWLVI